MNTFGKNLTLTTFGESHGKAMGGVIDGFPAGFKIDFERLYRDVAKRRPGSSVAVTARREADKPEFLSGINDEGITLGTPIGFIVRNTDQRSGDYDEMSRLFRPNHADYTYMRKYGLRDARGGGRSSARETVNWVVAGSLAAQWLETQGIRVESALTQVGHIKVDDVFGQLIHHPELPFSLEADNNLRTRMEDFVLQTKKSGDSVGGRVSCVIFGVPSGIGSPVAEKLHASLAAAMMSINAAKGFEYGIGFEGSSSFGTKTADRYLAGDDLASIRTATNYSGGIQGGISNGMPIFFNVAFKPTPTVMSALETIDVNGNPAVLNPAGRHDPCVAVRAVYVVKAMAELVIADHMLR